MSQRARLKKLKYCGAQQQIFDFCHRFEKNFLRPNEFYSIKRLSDDHDVLKVDWFSSWRRRGGGGGGVLFMLLPPPTLEQVIKTTVSLWKWVFFTSV